MWQIKLETWTWNRGVPAGHLWCGGLFFLTHIHQVLLFRPGISAKLLSSPLLALLAMIHARQVSVSMAKQVLSFPQRFEFPSEGTSQVMSVPMDPWKGTRCFFSLHPCEQLASTYQKLMLFVPDVLLSFLVSTSPCSWYLATPLDWFHTCLKTQSHRLSHSVLTWRLVSSQGIMVTDVNSDILDELSL